MLVNGKYRVHIPGKILDWYNSTEEGELGVSALPEDGQEFRLAVRRGDRRVHGSAYTLTIYATDGALYYLREQLEGFEAAFRDGKWETVGHKTVYNRLLKQLEEL